MGELLWVGAIGPLPALKVAVSESSGEVLWPANVYFQVAYPPSTRQFLKVMDKSENSIHSLYSELFESEAPPALAVTRHRDSKGFD